MGRSWLEYNFLSCRFKGRFPATPDFRPDFWIGSVLSSSDVIKLDISSMALGSTRGDSKRRSLTILLGVALFLLPLEARENLEAEDWGERNSFSITLLSDLILPVDFGV